MATPWAAPKRCASIFCSNAALWAPTRGPLLFGDLVIDSLTMTSTHGITRWTRSKDGILAGVCSGLAKSLDMDPWLIRIVFLVSFLFLGLSILVYIALAMSFPREDKLNKAMEPFFLGVCRRIALKTDTEVGVVRLFALALLGTSLGTAIIGYLALYLLLPEPHPLSIPKTDTSHSQREF